MKKYQKLLNLSIVDWLQFELAVKQIPSENIDYVTVLKLLVNDDSDDQRFIQGVSLLLDKVKTSNIDYKKIVKSLKKIWCIEKREVLIQLLDKMHAHQFDYDHLVKHAISKKSNLKHLAKRLLLQNFKDRLGYDVLITFLDFNHLCSDSKVQADTATECLLNLNKDQVDCDTLVYTSLVSTGLKSEYGRERLRIIANKILLKHFSEEISQSRLVCMYENSTESTKKEICKLLNNIPDEKLDYQAFLRAYWFRNSYIGSHYLNKIPAHALDCQEIFESMGKMSEYRDASNITNQLLNKIPREKLCYETLLKHAQSSHKITKNSACMLLFTKFHEKFSYDKLIEFFIAFDLKRETQEILVKILIDYFSNQLTYEYLIYCSIIFYDHRTDESKKYIEKINFLISTISPDEMDIETLFRFFDLPKFFSEHQQVYANNTVLDLLKKISIKQSDYDLLLDLANSKSEIAREMAHSLLKKIDMPLNIETHKNIVSLFK